MIGLVNGIGIAIFRVNPLIMTLGISMITLGLLTVEAQKQFTALVPGLRRDARLRALPDLHPVRPARLGADLGADHPRPALQRHRPDDLRDRRQPRRLAARRRARLAGAARSSTPRAACSSALAGVLLVGFNNAADLGIASPFLLPSVAAVVIGGTSIFGGFGGYAGTILGALILTLLDSLLVILDASARRPGRSSTD